MHRAFASFLLFISTQAFSQSFSVTAAPALPVGTFAQGGQISAAVTLRNNGPAYATGLVADPTAVANMIATTGFVTPYTYKFEVINNALGYEDGAIFNAVSTRTTPTSNGIEFPSGTDES